MCYLKILGPLIPVQAYPSVLHLQLQSENEKNEQNVKFEYK